MNFHRRRGKRAALQRERTDFDDKFARIVYLRDRFSQLRVRPLFVPASKGLEDTRFARQLGARLCSARLSEERLVGWLACNRVAEARGF